MSFRQHLLIMQNQVLQHLWLTPTLLELTTFRACEEVRVLQYLFFCRGLMMLRLSMTPRSAAGSAPPLGSGPWRLAPARPHIPSRGGAWCLGRALVRAPQVVRVTGGCWPPPGGWAAGQVRTGLCDICGLEVLKINKKATSQILLHGLNWQLYKVGLLSLIGVGLVKPDTEPSKDRHLVWVVWHGL